MKALNWSCTWHKGTSFMLCTHCAQDRVLLVLCGDASHGHGNAALGADQKCAPCLCRRVHPASTCMSVTNLESCILGWLL